MTGHGLLREEARQVGAPGLVPSVALLAEDGHVDLLEDGQRVVAVPLVSHVRDHVVLQVLAATTRAQR